MTLKKYEQSGFILETEGGFRLALDIGVYTPIAALEGVSVDAALVSHIHPDHFSPEHIAALHPKTAYLNRECLQALDGELQYEVVEMFDADTTAIGPITVLPFRVDHGPNVSIPPKDNFGFLITADSKTVYFAGDMYNPSGIDVSDLAVDYALLPVGGYYTFDPQAAFSFAQQFKSIGSIIAMHYHKNNHIDPARHEEFLALTKGKFVSQ